MSQMGKFISGTGIPIDYMEGNTGGLISPTTTNIIYLLGAGAVTVDGNPITNTLTISIAGSFAEIFHTDSGDATPASNEITMAGGSNINTSGSGSTVTYNLNNSIIWPATSADQLNGVITIDTLYFLHAYGIQNTFVGKGAGNFTLTNSQNSAFGATALESLTSGGGNTAIGTAALNLLTTANGNTSVGYNSLTVLDNGGGFNTAVGTSALSLLTGGVRNISIGADSGGNYTSTEYANILIGNDGVTGDVNTIRIGTQGSGSSPAEQDTCYIAGITGITVANAAYVTLNTATGQLGMVAGGSLLGWIVVSGAAANMAVNYGYIADNGLTVTLTLPAVSAVGSMIRVTGLGSGGWMIAQNGGNTINFGASSTTPGVGGSLSSTNQHDSIELVCVVADAEWNVLSVQGNVTFI